jgi:hypothetical protein
VKAVPVDGGQEEPIAAFNDCLPEFLQIGDKCDEHTALQDENLNVVALHVQSCDTCLEELYLRRAVSKLKSKTRN